MGKYYYASHVLCPYYKGESQMKIRCVGILPKTVQHQAYANKTDMREQRETYCKGCHNKCLIAQTLNRKYDYE